MEDIELKNDQQTINHHQFGFRSAEHSKSNPDSIKGFLDRVYENFINEQRLDEKGIIDKINKLKNEVKNLNIEKAASETNLLSLKNSKDALETKETELEIEKSEINGDNDDQNIIPFVIATFITILLTLYLFVFYSSSGYSAFYGIKKGSLGFINPDVFAEASSKGGGVISLIILFPVIFLGLGFLIHDSLDKNEKLVEKNKPRKFGLIISLLTITLIADAFIGYKISQGIHRNEFNAGLTETVWNFKMIFYDINFYLVLVLGFVVYVIWGLLLHYVLSHNYLKSEKEKERIQKEFLDKKIERLRNEIAEIENEINKEINTIEILKTNITQKEKEINGLENGDIPINTAALKGSVGEFMGGWQAYTNGSYGPQATTMIDQALKVQEQWISDKIESLKLNKTETNV